jgi:DNA-binding transcriptional ArsR family regulator
MGESHTKIRRHGKIHELPDDVRKEVDALLIENATYEEISEYLKSKGYDISRSAVGRYGKDFMNYIREVRIIEDQAKQIVSGNDDAMVLEEAIVTMLMSEGINLNKIPRIVSDFARLQASSVLRERMKAEFRKKAEATADAVAKIVKKGGLSDSAASQIRAKILGIAK